MTEKEHYDRFLKDRYPNMPRDFNESEGYYYHDMAQFGFRSFQYRAGLRPTTPGKIGKEQLAAYKEDDPATIVDRLNGFYGVNDDPYPVSKKESEAAREIVRLREENSILQSYWNKACRDLAKQQDQIAELQPSSFLNKPS